jgi:hypothetical protein
MLNIKATTVRKMETAVKRLLRLLARNIHTNSSFWYLLSVLWFGEFGTDYVRAAYLYGAEACLRS